MTREELARLEFILKEKEPLIEKLIVLLDAKEGYNSYIDEDSISIDNGELFYSVEVRSCSCRSGSMEHRTIAIEELIKPKEEIDGE